ncbi:MAG TPA: SulP family inorganic anion transporter [Nitrospirota bacterium]|nr:SulP family inorganic anion transporter [Nitrospirota bacterium]
MFDLNALVKKSFPAAEWWPQVNRRTLRADLLAGLTGAIIVLPQGVAFAMIAGLPPEYGLYTAIVPAIVAAFFGSSFHLVSGPTTAISIVLFTTVSPLAPVGSPTYIEMVLTITFLTGLFQLSLGFARLGALVNFVSHSVVIGFTTGAALLIGTSQLSNFLGIPASMRHAFIHVWVDVLRHLPDINLIVIAIAVTTLVTAILLKQYLPKLPGMLIAMVIGSILSLLLNGKEHGVRLVGSLPAHFPPFSLPDLSTSNIRIFAPAAVALTMLGLAEAVSIARAVATRSHQRIDSNQEFIGQGLANMVGSFFSSYASSGSFTRTGVNFDAGARTPLASVFAAVALLLILLLIAPLTAYLPIPAMAGVLLLVAWNLIDFHHLATIIRTSRQETAVLAVTFLATLLVELEFAIYVGVILSLLLYLNRTSHPAFVTLVADHQDDSQRFININRKELPECPQLKIMRVDGSLFFGAVNHFSEELRTVTRASPEQAHILIVGGGINFIDVAGAETLANEAHRLHLEGRKLYLCSLKGEVVETLHRGGYVDRIGEENILGSKKAAIRALVPRLDPERCRMCVLRVFNECSQMPGA